MRAHANAAVVLDFLRQILRCDSIDDRGATLISSINCTSSRARVPNDPKGWANAFWNGEQMAYGQLLDPSGFYRSLAAAQDIVGHEIFHAVTEHASDLVYQAQSGALNESYSDIFGVMVANWSAQRWSSQNRKTEWEWKIGGDALPGGTPFRSMADPSDPSLGANSQPKHMKKYRDLPVDEWNDYGGVHINSGIPNYCAYLILTEADTGGNQILTADEYAQLFYITLTARINRTATFASNKEALMNSARSLFRTAPDKGQAKIAVVAEALKEVGL